MGRLFLRKRGDYFRLTLSLWSAALALSCAGSNVICGEGTVEHDGRCVVSLDGGSFDAGPNTDGGPMLHCDDGIVDPGEECDNGDDNADEGLCTDSCRFNVCGDGLILAGVEECDDGNASLNDGCPDGPEGTCRSAFCGDGFLKSPGEVCDGAVTHGVCEACTSIACDGGFEDCNDSFADGCETDLSNDPENCGECGLSCGGNECSDGLCLTKKVAGSARTLPIGPRGAAIAIGAHAVFFTDESSVRYWQPETQHQGFVPNTTGVSDIAYDDGYLYFGHGGTVRQDENLISAAEEIASPQTARIMEASGDWLYFTYSANIYRVSMSNPEGAELVAHSPEWIADFVVDESHLYWATHSGYTVLKIYAYDRTQDPFDGPTVIFTDDPVNYFGMELDANHLYFEYQPGGEKRLIELDRVTLAMTTIQTTQWHQGFHGMLVQGDFLYGADRVSVKRVHIPTRTVETIARHTGGQAKDLAINSGWIYLLTESTLAYPSSNGGLFRVPLRTP